MDPYTNVIVKSKERWNENELTSVWTAHTGERIEYIIMHFPFIIMGFFFAFLNVVKHNQLLNSLHVTGRFD